MPRLAARGPRLLLALALGCAMQAHAADLPQVQLDTANTAGRQVEELTKKAVARDYARAWRTLVSAMENNNAGLVEEDFVGTAAEKLSSGIAAQLHSGLRTRYVDHGHKLDVLFYSPEGLSIQVRDTARLERQVLDGNTVVFSEQVTRHYIAIMTPTEVRWKVRLLQESE